MPKRKNAKQKIKEPKQHGTLAGICLIFISIFLFISLISYTPLDSSFSTVSSLPPTNAFGFYGAVLSDITMQFFGMGGFFICIVLFVWGINFINKKIYYMKYKYLNLLLGIIFFSTALTLLSTMHIGKLFAEKLEISYLLGGTTGYLFVKSLLYITGGEETSYNISVLLIFIITIFLVKRCVFFKFSAIHFEMKKLGRILNFKKNNNKKEELDDNFTDENVAPSLSFISLEENHPGSQEMKSEPIGISNEKKIEEAMIAGNSGEYSLPNIDLLDRYQSSTQIMSEEKIKSMAEELTTVLEEFGVRGEIINVKQGPVVTMFEFKPAPGIKTSRVISLSDDIARSMSSVSARIATIPGQNAIGIELPNKSRQIVFLRDLLSSETFINFSKGIPIVLGKDISGIPIMADLTKMPHLLVAGTTGSGKSVSINAMILSILFKFTSEQCKLIMIDPKMLELSVYDEIPHLLTPVVTDPKKAVFALKWAVSEMENRYRQMSKLGVRNIDGFNKKLQESREKGDLLVRKVQTGFDQDTGRPIFETQQLDFENMPYIVIIVDEMADLMLVAGKEIESAVQRLAQMARAAGIHLIMATQRPSVDVITGTIKANFPTRVSFQVTSKIDSRTILGEQGAEQLLGQGDMLFMQGGGRLMRVHGPFVKDTEVERIVGFTKLQGNPTYVDVICNADDQEYGNSSSSLGGDDMFDKAVDIVRNDKKISISYIQRKLQIGYNRAARIVEEMEEKGMVSPPNHTGKREILI